MRETQPSNFGIAIELSEDDISNASPGGQVKKFIAAVALNVGDAVILSAVNTVTKDVTAGNHFKRVGIVVGGTSTGMRALSGSDAVGLAAAAINGQVLVQINGIAWAVADTATVVVGDKLKPGTTTAGRLMDGTDTTDLVAGITGSIIGSALDASAAAGDKIRVLIALG